MRKLKGRRCINNILMSRTQSLTDNAQKVIPVERERKKKVSKKYKVKKGFAISDSMGRKLRKKKRTAQVQKTMQTETLPSFLTF